MKRLTKGEANQVRNSDSCLVHEYPLGSETISGATISLYGRYPQRGLATNECCTELAQVLSGQGRITVNGESSPLSEGDQLLIEPGDRYYWEGKMELFMASAPAWSPDQHRLLDEATG